MPHPETWTPRRIAPLQVTEPPAVRPLTAQEAELLTTLECLLALDWTKSPGLDAQGSEDMMTMELPLSGARLQMSRDGLTEVHLDVDDDRPFLIAALEARFGPSHELANTYRRIHRWLVNGHEVMLDFCRSSSSFAIVA